jgi:FAD/FMN-containing dehydrogenase
MSAARDNIFNILVDIVGEDHVVADPEKIASYATDLSFTSGKKPIWIVFPESTVDIQALVRMANANQVPIVPRSSSVGFHGAGIPVEEGVVIDLRRMNRIVEINDRNRYVIIEPGVTFLQLHKALKSHGFRPAKPFLDSPASSVVSSFMERNPVATAADFTYGTEHVISYTLVSPTGENFTVGHPPLENTPASAPDGPGLNFYRLFQGAQGTLGIVTRMIIRVLPIPKQQKVFFFPSSSLTRTVEIIQRVQKYELGLECFVMNQFNLAVLASICSEDQIEALEKGTYVGSQGAATWGDTQIQRFNVLRKTLPAWTGVICLSALGPIPGEKIAYQTIDLAEIAGQIGVEPMTTIGGADSLNQLIGEELLFSRRMQKRFGYRGVCRQMMFLCEPDRAVEFNATVLEVCEKALYPVEDVGFYLLPMERARAFYCCADLHFNPDDPDESARIVSLFDQLSENLVEMGAVFDRPYGKLAKLVYNRSGTYATYLKQIKRSIDPNNIMNPGKLCF